MRVAVIGAGIMGSGIGQLAAMHGHDVRLRDVGEAPLQKAGAAIDRSLDRFAKKGTLTAEDAAGARDRLALTTDLGEAVADADVVVEAVPEILDLKREVFAEIVAKAPADAVLGTNTSQLSITSIASQLGDAAPRVVGMHFFNPPVLMRLCELIRGLETSDDSIERARAFAEGIGKTVVVCQKDSPGFITSRAYAILRLECLRMLEEGVATAEDIDTAMKLGFNFPMGPLELGDFNGLDTYLHAIESLERVFGDRFKPTVSLRNMVASGRLGQKAGHGFYRYDDDGNRMAE
jgi:3-hydroxybutyryl-CoA dehydrogenase